ncbi:MAG: type I-C CRISPR-associated protein Cas7/Csd2, partial [Nitrospirae bacterium]
MKSPISNRYDFVLFFDVKDGNPNGDPDAGNLPRVDPETGHGLVTDVCLKRKVRNYVLLSKPGETGYDIFIKEKAVLNTLIDQAHEQEEVKSKDDKTEAARQFMCRNYYDVRTFGAVMSTGKNAGQVRGPVQLTFARSIDQVIPLEHAITRVAKTTEERAETGGSEMGRKFTIPYALYRCHGFVSAAFAEDTGFSEEDLNLLWDALVNMFEHDHSAARGQMTTRKLIIFKHDSKLGNAPSHRLFEMVSARAKNTPPRDFSDYELIIPSQEDMPSGVTLIIKP